jgi:hypothetical protein
MNLEKDLAFSNACGKYHLFFGVLCMPDNIEAAEIICPKCKRTEIVYLKSEDIPKCKDCNVRMVFRELLTEGKSY